MSNQTLPAGTYYIGDMSYVMPRDWASFYDRSFETKRNPSDVVTLDDDTKVLFCRAAPGYRVCYDNNHNEYMIKSGLIGAVAVKDLQAKHSKRMDSGNTFKFSGPVKMTCHNGTIVFSDGSTTVEIDANE